MRVYLVNRYFWPDESATSQLLTDLAEDLSATGHAVEVFTSRQLYNQPRARLPKRQIWQGIRINRLWTSSFGRGRLMGRLLDILTFHLVLRYANHIRVQPDAWFVMTDPPLIANTVLKLRRKLQGRVIHHVDDVYPDLAVALGSWPRFGGVLSLLNRRVQEGLAHCDQVLALGECMAGVLRAKGVDDRRLAITPPWADGSKLSPLAPAQNRFRREVGMAADDLVVMYSGNMGRGHRFETILEAARRLAHDKRIHFVLIGDGARRPQIEAFQQAHGLARIILLPPQPRERLRETLSAGDVHLISLDPKVQGLIVPSKLAGILAVGRPAIFLGEEHNSVAAAILQGQCGYVIPEGEGGRLAAIIQELGQDPDLRLKLQTAARRLFDKEYDRRVVVSRIIAKITDNRNPSDTEPSAILAGSDV